MRVTANEYSAGWLAEHLGGALEGTAALLIHGVNNLDDAESDEITLIASEAYARRWSASQAGAAVVTSGIEVAGHDPEHRSLIVVDDAQVAVADLLDLFAPPPPRPDEGVHPTAWVHPDTTIGAGVCIGPHVSIDAGVIIGDGVTVHAGVRLYPEVVIGEGTVLHANVVVRERCLIGREVIVHAGACIGSDGFGYVADPRYPGLRKVEHIGTVVIADRAEIGANACIDRGKFGPTQIGEGTKLDNLVQVGHNVQIGNHCAISGLTGFAGSSRVGNGVTIGGHVGVRDHAVIGDGAFVGAKSGVMKDVKPGQKVAGLPAEEFGVALRREAAIRKLPALLRKMESKQGDAG